MNTYGHQTAFGQLMAWIETHVWLCCAVADAAIALDRYDRRDSCTSSPGQARYRLSSSSGGA